MSHIVSVKTAFTNEKAIERAIEVLLADGIVTKNCGLGEHKVFNKTVDGHGIHLRGWRFPFVIRENGRVDYDNYEGSWGSLSELDKFATRYNAETIKLTAEEAAMQYTETITEDGQIELEVFV